MGVKPSTFGPWIRGVDASTGVLSQPKGSIPRGSNLLLSKRGSLRTCDGTDIIDAFNGVPTSGRGRAMAEFFFAPTGVAGYYLRIMAALDQHLGSPQNLAASLTTGGTLTVGQTYYYVVTAIDGAGGETTVSNQVSVIPTSGNQSVSLTWNMVPNAYAYNVYRGTASGSEMLLSGSGLPVTTNAYIDNGTASGAGGTFAVQQVETSDFGGGVNQYEIVLTTNETIGIGSTAVYTAGSNSALNGSYTITGQASSRGFIANGPALPGLNGSTGGTLVVSAGVSPPTSDTTQQTALYAMPPAAEGIDYTDENIVALFPAPQAGGTLQQGYSPSGGVAGAVGLQPQMVQFTNQAVLALGNGFAPQVYSDPNGTPTNPATIVGISSISVDANGVVTINTSAPHNINPTITPNTYPAWQPNTAYATGSVVEPSPANGYYYTAVSSGISAGSPPNWPLTVGGTVFEGGPFSLEWQNSGTTTVTSDEGLGANVVIAGVFDSVYDTNGNGASAFVTIAIPSTTQVQIVNPHAIGQPPSSGGTLTVTTIPVVSTFTPSYPVWTATVAYAINSVIEPTAVNNYYYKAIQGGTSGSTQPSFPTTVGATVTDGSVVWQNAGTLISAAPPPKGCAHLAVYAGSLWMFNTWVTNTGPNSNTGTGVTPVAPTTNVGLDGPCSLRMSDVNNLQSWNPINQAFLDKDDGTEGLGLGSFTIAAQGIPPEGSLCAFKRRGVYQIVGVFGADNFLIQRVQSDMGILSPRTLQFVPGFGLMRLTYIGIAVFDGVNDRVVSTQVQPYLIESNDPDNSDIVAMDPEWQTVCQSALVANPPMYVTAIPIASIPGNSNGALTRILCFDMVLKAWAVVDLPFPISTMFGVVTFSTVAATVMGSYNDGTLQQWQNEDLQWATAVSGSQTPGQIAWSMESPTAASKDADERFYLRRMSVIGQQTSGAPSTMNVQLQNGGVQFGNQNLPMPTSGDFQVQAAGGQTGRRFNAIISGTGRITIDSISYHLEPRPVGVMAGAIS
jgi:hypothetical protein